MIHYYHASQLGAPVLSGTPGALKTLLRTCLIDGFGAVAAQSIGVTSGVASVNLGGAHPFIVDGPVLIAGATPGALNGIKRVIWAGADSIRFAAPGVPDGAATGTITAKVPGAGWLEPWVGGQHTIALKPSSAEAADSVLRLDDSGATTARARAHESMSDIDHGLGPMPTDAQMPGGGHWPKSSQAGGGARDYFVIADERGFLLGVAPGGGDRYGVRYFGDAASLKSGDAWASLLTCDSGGQASGTGVPDGCLGYSGRTDRAGAYLQRHHHGIGGAVQAQRMGAHHTGARADAYSGAAGYSQGTYPNAPNNGLMLCPLELWVGAHQRGAVPGLWHAHGDCGHSFATGQVIDGTDDMAARRLLAVRCGPPDGTAQGTVFIDLTGPWER